MRLLVAEALKLPFTTPFLLGKTAEDFRAGANMAVSGATALSQQVFKDMGLDLTILPPYSLDVQLEWLKRVLHMLAPTGPGAPPLHAYIYRKKALDNYSSKLSDMHACRAAGHHVELSFPVGGDWDQRLQPPFLPEPILHGPDQALAPKGHQKD